MSKDDSESLVFSKAELADLLNTATSDLRREVEKAKEERDAALQSGLAWEQDFTELCNLLGVTVDTETHDGAMEAACDVVHQLREQLKLSTTATAELKSTHDAVVLRLEKEIETANNAIALANLLIEKRDAATAELQGERDEYQKTTERLRKLNAKLRDCIRSCFDFVVGESKARADEVAKHCEGALLSNTAPKEYIHVSELATLHAQLEQAEKERNEWRQACITGNGSAGKLFQSETETRQSIIKSLREKLEQAEAAIVVKDEALRLMVELWKLNNAEKCACVGGSPDCPHPGPCEMCIARKALSPTCGNSVKDELERLRNIRDGVLKRTPVLGSWSNECPFCFAKTPCGDIPHKEECILIIAQALTTQPES